MSGSDSDKVFAGSIPKFYETHLVPLIFEPYAADLALRLASRSLHRVLEIAAGTGVVTRHLASVLPESVSIVATDLNQPMLDLGSEIGTKRPVEWRQADAMQLPFSDGMFDAVVCQFGVMFFPEKSKAFSEARRVLRPGGVFVFNVWDRIEENEFADTVTTALESVFPKNRPRFLARTPYGYYDRPTIEQDLASAGFTTYDGEHHRFAFANLDILKPESTERDRRGLIGVDHLAYTYASVKDLLENYSQLKTQDIKPYWCVHHGMTVSMYYADPDGNQMEFQVDCFGSSEEANAFMEGPHFAANPIGVEYDPDDWLAKLRAGTPTSEFLVRTTHAPVSPIRGSFAS